MWTEWTEWTKWTECSGAPFNNHTVRALETEGRCGLHYCHFTILSFRASLETPTMSAQTMQHQGVLTTLVTCLVRNRVFPQHSGIQQKWRTLHGNSTANHQPR